MAISDTYSVSSNKQVSLELYSVTTLTNTKKEDFYWRQIWFDNHKLCVFLYHREPIKYRSLGTNQDQWHKFYKPMEKSRPMI